MGGKSPSQAVPVTRNSDRGDHREPATLCWDLAAPWAKVLKAARKMINARAETAHEHPRFKNALADRRCHLAANGFYEWKRDGSRKQPCFIRLKGGEPFSMVGIWERWGPRAVLGRCYNLRSQASIGIRGSSNIQPLPTCRPKWIESVGLSIHW